MVKNESERRYKVAAYIWSPVLYKGIYIKAVREGAAGLGDLQVFHMTSARGGDKNGEAIINNSGVYKPMSIFLIMSRDRLQWNDLSKGYVLPTPPLSHSLCFLSWYSADHWSHLCLLVKNRFPGLSPRDSALVLGHGHYQASAAHYLSREPWIYFYMQSLLCPLLNWFPLLPLQPCLGDLGPWATSSPSEAALGHAIQMKYWIQTEIKDYGFNFSVSSLLS